MRSIEPFDNPGDRIVVIVDAKSDIQNLGKISSELGYETCAFKLGEELFQFDRPWSINNMLKERGIKTWLDTNYMLDPDQISQAVNGTFDRGIQKVSVSPLSGVKSLITASSETNDDNKIFIPMPSYHNELVIPFLEDVLEANENLPHRKKITDIMCNVGLIETVKQMGDFTVIATGIRFDKHSLDDHPAVMTPKEAIQTGADILAIGRLITKYSKDNYRSTLLKIIDDIQNS